MHYPRQQNTLRFYPQLDDFFKVKASNQRIKEHRRGFGKSDIWGRLFLGC